MIKLAALMTGSEGYLRSNLSQLAFVFELINPL
jgi:hypothetical protein